jgi:hypothetical protein
MKVNGQFHIPTWEKNPCAHCMGEWIDFRARLDVTEMRKKLFDWQGIEL